MDVELIKKAIQKAMKEMQISEKNATIEFLFYMCGHGTIEDFKDVINYYIKNQERLNENERNRDGSDKKTCTIYAKD